MLKVLFWIWNKWCCGISSSHIILFRVQSNKLAGRAKPIQANSDSRRVLSARSSVDPSLAFFWRNIQPVPWPHHQWQPSVIWAFHIGPVLPLWYPIIVLMHAKLVMLFYQDWSGLCWLKIIILPQQHTLPTPNEVLCVPIVPHIGALQVRTGITIVKLLCIFHPRVTVFTNLFVRYVCKVKYRIAPIHLISGVQCCCRGGLWNNVSSYEQNSQYLTILSISLKYKTASEHRTKRG